MSFFSDLFEGQFSNLGEDLSNTFSSLANHPDQLAETLGVGGLIAAPFLLPELGSAIGLADVAGGGAFDATTVAGDIAAGAEGGSVAGDVSSTVLGLGDLASAPAVDAGLSVDSTGALGDAAGFPSSGVSIPSTDASGALGDAAGFPSSGLSSPTADAAAPATAATTPAGGTTAAAPAGATTSTGAGATTGGTAAGGSAAGGGGGGFTSTLNSFISSPYTKLALAGAPLALTLAMGEQQLPASAQALQAQALQMQQTGLTNLAQAQAGVLNPGQTAQLQQMNQDLLNQWRQTLANQGVQDPTKDARWPQIQALIDSQVTQQTATLIQNNINNALAETGQASTALAQIAQMQMTADANFTNAILNATKSLGLLAGLNSGTTIKVTSA